ncbi:hypothetical protein PPERSA_04526 [Pseudocohnilembus persalinus]|uniref:Bax inhibitor 1-related n=1 Tax=Pseudocohnilembus persalinus TaxID=266149 RepID=A0A0V0QTG1_PSEPJ|nr:hypothetical protein PPERSA_04526 [Pseudocohnilembus persalinus]|eukprot:KRX05489.1 hypothetical protein PPERSA_04526 [Pseudocohnilembus persalinus]
MSYQYQQGNQEGIFQDNLQKDKYTHQFSQETTNLLAGQRNKFCQKVFGILTTQVLVTVGFIALAQQSIGFRVFQENNQFLMTLSSIGSVIILLVLGCVKTIARKTPTNYYLLFAFTIMEAYGVSALTLRYDSQIVLQSGIMTLLSFGSLTAFAFLTKKDFTKYHGFLFMVFQTVMIFSLIFALFGTKSMNIVFSAIGILIKLNVVECNMFSFLAQIFNCILKSVSDKVMKNYCYFNIDIHAIYKIYENAIN